MAFEFLEDRDQFLIGARHRLFEGCIRAAHFFARDLGQRLRRADPGDNVLALRIDQELAVIGFLACRRVTREGNARRRCVAHISEHHGLHIDSCTPAFGDIVQTTVGFRAIIHP